MIDAKSLKDARAAKQKLREQLSGLAEVRGIGLTRRASGYAVKLNVERLPDEWTLPDDVDGVPVVVAVVGKIKPR